MKLTIIVFSPESEEHDQKRERGHAALQSATEESISGFTSKFNEELTKLVLESDKAHEEYSTKHGAATDALDRKLTDMLTNLSGDHDQKREETRRALTKLIGLVQSEIARLVQTNEAQFAQVTELSQAELGNLRKEVAHAVGRDGREVRTGCGSNDFKHREAGAQGCIGGDDDEPGIPVGAGGSQPRGR